MEKLHFERLDEWIKGKEIYRRVAIISGLHCLITIRSDRWLRKLEIKGIANGSQSFMLKHSIDTLPIDILNDV